MPVPSIIGHSPVMRGLLDMVRTVADSEATILVEGESGTGKELVARAIHSLSPRRAAPFVALNCAALPDSLLESELFGHEKGAFTGADRRNDGRFLLAHTGTLFLDEIGTLTAAMQAKILRAIQNGEIQRVGSGETLRVDVRIVAATNRNLKNEVRAGRFRDDLYYRLNVVALYTPPLRERREDIPLLAGHFLREAALRNHRNTAGFTPEAMLALEHYPWPGNVRELENAVERALVVARGPFLGPDDLPPAVTGKKDPADHYCLDHIGNIPLKELEREAIRATLKSVDGNRSEASRRLGISRKTLRAKMENYGLEG
jgi:two-component system response regulator HydG